MANALAVMAFAPRGGLLHAPDTYMDKLAIGPGFDEGRRRSRQARRRQRQSAGQGEGREASKISASACSTVRAMRTSSTACAASAARVHLISDGDVAGVINTTDPTTGIDMYVGRAARRRACWRRRR